MFGLSPVQNLITAYYDAVGKPPPKVGSKTEASDKELVSKVLGGDCLKGYSNRRHIDDMLVAANAFQPQHYISKEWHKAIAVSQPLPRYCSAFILSAHTQSNSLYVISRWLHYVSTHCVNMLSENASYIMDRFTFYQDSAEGDLRQAAIYCEAELQKLLDGDGWITKPSFNELVDMLFSVWGEILRYQYHNLHIGHLLSDKIYTNSLTAYLRQNGLLKIYDGGILITTHSPPLRERMITTCPLQARWELYR